MRQFVPGPAVQYASGALLAHPHEGRYRPCLPAAVGLSRVPVAPLLEMERNTRVHTLIAKPADPVRMRGPSATAALAPGNDPVQRMDVRGQVHRTKEAARSSGTDNDKEHPGGAECVGPHSAGSRPWFPTRRWGATHWSRAQVAEQDAAAWSTTTSRGWACAPRGPRAVHACGRDCGSTRRHPPSTRRTHARGVRTGRRDGPNEEADSNSCCSAVGAEQLRPTRCGLYVSPRPRRSSDRTPERPSCNLTTG